METKTRSHLIYAGIDLLCAALYIVVGTAVDWTAEQTFTYGSWAAAAAMVVAAAGTLSKRRTVAIVALSAVLAGAVVLLGFLAISAGVLFGVYRDFGRSATLLLAVISVAALQLYVLVPVLQLRHLRASARPMLATAALAPVGILVSAASIAESSSLRVPEALSSADRAAVTSTLRKAIEGSAPGELALVNDRPMQGAAIVSVWSKGVRKQRIEGRGKTISSAILDAASKLDVNRDARIQVDLVVARGPLPLALSPLGSAALISGVDGVGAELDGDREVLLTPDELIYAGHVRGKKQFPFAAFLGASTDGPNMPAIAKLIAARAKNSGSEQDLRYFRFRTESFVESASGKDVLELRRGTPAGPDVTAESLKNAAVAGGQYLLAHQDPNGRFVYTVDLLTGKTLDAAEYNLPRHAGTTYYLAQLYRETKDPAVRAGVERAIEFMVDMIEESRCEGTTAKGDAYACVAEAKKPVASLGSTALAAVALAEYRLATDDGKYDAIHRKLANFILAMQLPDGKFAHYFHVQKQVKDTVTQLRYYSGEATLALIRSHAVFADPRMIQAAERGLDALMASYDFFAGRYYFGEEHWTCISAGAAWPHLKHRRYLDFCGNYAGFLRAKQYSAAQGSPEQADLEGSYGLTPFFVPGNNPVSSSTEAMISAYQLSVFHGEPDLRIRDQVLRATGYLLRQQIREDNAFWTPAPAAIGAIPNSQVSRVTRIDTVQHACSAMLRASAFAAR